MGTGGTRLEIIEYYYSRISRSARLIPRRVNILATGGQ